MSGVTQAVFQNQRSFGTVPGAPTIGTATVSGTTASVPFTAPASDGGSVITSYTATSTPGSITGILYQSGSGTVTVSGLTGGTSYTFKVKATNAIGTGPESAASNSVTAQVVGQQAYTTPGTYCWVAPTGVTSVSFVAVSGGGGPGYGLCYYCCCTFSTLYFGAPGGGGGGLAYANNVSVSAGSSYQLNIPSGGSFTTPGGAFTTGLISGQITGGATGSGGTTGGSGGFRFSSGWTGGGTGGNGGNAQAGTGSRNPGAGGGGAGGYTGTGGFGGQAGISGGVGFAPVCNTGGGGGGGSSTNTSSGTGRSGGGVGLLGKGCNGAGGSANSAGGGGSGGTSGSTNGGAYGGGGGGGYFQGGVNYCRGTGGNGAVRIIWPGNTRQFPSTCTGNL